MKRLCDILPARQSVPSLGVSVVPVVVLLVSFVLIIVGKGASAISDYSQGALLLSAAVALVLGLLSRSLTRRSVIVGLRRSATQILPAVPMLIFIAALSTTWMVSGVVPTLIDYGMKVIEPRWFLVTTCLTCAVVSVVTGSSWSTIATIGVAFMGIGAAMGYSEGWIAGAVISGSYFGDKVSPLSDTTVVASSTCGVDLFVHIRYMMITTVPAMLLSLVVFGIEGFVGTPAAVTGEPEVVAALEDVFVITPWALVIPVLTMLLIVMRVNTLLTLLLSALMGAVGVFIFQPDSGADVSLVMECVWSGYESQTGMTVLDGLISTDGILGMLPVIYLVLSALVFGWLLISTGMLDVVTTSITVRLRRRVSIVASVIVSGIVLNGCTADQYLSLIIDGNMFRGVFRRNRMEPRLLSRTIEDGVSVTSPLIPWSSCGVTQATVLGVPTFVYLPYCVFNYLTPVVSLAVAWTGFKVRECVAGRKAVTT